MSTITKRLTVDQYEQMVENGTLPETNRFELINGVLVEKMTKGGKHWRLRSDPGERFTRFFPPAGMSGSRSRSASPRRIASRSRTYQWRGGIDDYEDRQPGPEDVALVVEVAESTLADDRTMAVPYGGGGIPVFWIVNIPGRQLEVYANPAGGAYPAPTILAEKESVDLTIGGQVVGRIAVADLLPRRS